MPPYRLDLGLVYRSLDTTLRLFQYFFSIRQPRSEMKCGWAGPSKSIAAWKFAKKGGKSRKKHRGYKIIDTAEQRQRDARLHTQCKQ